MQLRARKQVALKQTVVLLRKPVHYLYTSSILVVKHKLLHTQPEWNETMKRSLRFESLETRKLLAADIGLLAVNIDNSHQTVNDDGVISYPCGLLF